MKTEMVLSSARLVVLTSVSVVRAAPEDELRAVIDRYVAAQNAHDLGAVAELLWDSPEFLWITRGAPIWGRQPALTRFECCTAEPGDSSRHCPTLRIMLIADGVAQTYVPIMFTIGPPGTGSEDAIPCEPSLLRDVDRLESGEHPSHSRPGAVTMCVPRSHIQLRLSNLFNAQTPGQIGWPATGRRTTGCASVEERGMENSYAVAILDDSFGRITVHRMGILAGALLIAAQVLAPRCGLANDPREQEQRADLQTVLETGSIAQWLNGAVLGGRAAAASSRRRSSREALLRLLRRTGEALPLYGGRYQNPARGSGYAAGER